MSNEWSVVGKKGRIKVVNSRKGAHSSNAQPSKSIAGTNNKQEKEEKLELRGNQQTSLGLSQPSARDHTTEAGYQKKYKTQEGLINAQGRRSHSKERTFEGKAKVILDQVKSAREEIEQSAFWKELQRRMQQAEEDAVEASPSNSATWDSIQEIVVLGLGSLEKSAASRHQLGLALLLAANCGNVQSAIKVRDPVFTELDSKILSDCRCQVLCLDSEAFKAVTHPTLFYMPHCPASICHNVIVANWKSETLPSLAIVGNSFVSIANRWQEMPGHWKREMPVPESILRLVAANAVVDVAVKDCEFSVRGFFNDMSVHLFPSMPFESGKFNALDLSHLLHQECLQ